MCFNGHGINGITQKKQKEEKESGDEDWCIKKKMFSFHICVPFLDFIGCKIDCLLESVFSFNTTECLFCVSFEISVQLEFIQLLLLWAVARR